MRVEGCRGKFKTERTDASFKMDMIDIIVVVHWPVVLKVMCNVQTCPSLYSRCFFKCFLFMTLFFELDPCHIAACCHYPSQDHEKEVDNRTVELEMLRERRTAVHEELQRLDELRAKEAEDYKAPTCLPVCNTVVMLLPFLKYILLFYTIL